MDPHFYRTGPNRVQIRSCIRASEDRLLWHRTVANIIYDGTAS